MTDSEYGQDFVEQDELYDSSQVWKIWANMWLLTSFWFYFIASNVMHIIADRYYPATLLPSTPSDFVEWQRSIFGSFADWIYETCRLKDIIEKVSKIQEPNIPKEMFQSKRNEILREWVVSFIHAFLTAVFGIWIFTGLQERWMEEDDIMVGDGDGTVRYNEYRFLLMHSCGYFLADFFVNPSFMFGIHHLCPLPFLHVLFTHDASLRNVCLALWLAECGNTPAHGATILFCKLGNVFLVVRAVSFWISRPIAMWFAYLGWRDNVPVEYEGTWISSMCFVMFLGVAGVNLLWMVCMILPSRLRSRILQWYNPSIKMD